MIVFVLFCEFLVGKLIFKMKICFFWLNLFVLKMILEKVNIYLMEELKLII